MRLFATWSRDQLVSAIQSLEESLTAGVQSVSNPAQGSVAYTSPENAFSILRSLYARLDEHDGVRGVRTGPRIISQRISGGTF
jgi:hypothetical protein